MADQATDAAAAQDAANSADASATAAAKSAATAQADATAAQADASQADAAAHDRMVAVASSSSGLSGVDGIVPEPSSEFTATSFLAVLQEAAGLNGTWNLAYQGTGNHLWTVTSAGITDRTLSRF